MNELKNKNEITSLELVEQINIFRKQEGNRAELHHNDLLKIIRDEFEEEIGMGKISQTLYEHPQNKQKYPMFILTLNQAKQVLMRESKFVRKAVIEYIEKLEQQLQNPYKNLSTQQMMILTLQEQEKIAERVDVLEYKVDNEIRVDNGEQRKIQKAVSTRIFQRIDIVPQLLENKKFMFQALYRDLKDRFGVASYRDIKRKDLRNCLEYISTWIEPADFRTAS
nr:ORF6C domain-containing protein [Fusobacterium gastrosuis]